MEQMDAEAPAAAELLRLMAFLAPEPVARDWLSEGAEHLPEILYELVTDQLAWNRSLRTFRRYGLVEVNEGALVMHRLVQAVTRDRLAANERQAWATAAVQVVDAAYPEDAYRPREIRIWERCAALLGHAAVATDHAEALCVVPEVTASLLSNLASYHHSQGRYEDALPFFKRALTISEATLGDNHPTVATWLNNIAGLYRDQGRYEEAEPLYLRALTIDEATLGDNHPEVAISLNNLAGLYEEQGRYEEAEPLYIRCLAILDATLGPDHPNKQIGHRNYERFLQQRDAAS